MADLMRVLVRRHQEVHVQLRNFLLLARALANLRTSVSTEKLGIGSLEGERTLRFRWRLQVDSTTPQPRFVAV